MHPLRGAAVVAALVGVALVASAAVAGDVQFGLFLIVPFVTTTSPLGGLGMLLLFVAVALWAFSRMPRHDRTPAVDAARAEEPGGRARHGGVVLIGPIPIVWGSDRRVLPWMVAAGAALLLVAWLVLR